MTAPSIKEALRDCISFMRGDIAGTAQRDGILREAEAALATLSPPAGERRDAIARINKIVNYAFNEGWTQGTIEETSRRGGRSWEEFKSRYEDEINKALASGLVQDEAAILFIHNYLIERDQALGHEYNEDEIAESAKQIFDGAIRSARDGGEG